MNDQENNVHNANFGQNANSGQQAQNDYGAQAHQGDINRDPPYPEGHKTQRPETDADGVERSQDDQVRKEPASESGSIDPVGASQVEQERNPLSDEEHRERENRRKGEMEQAQREEAEAAEVLRQKSAARHRLTARHNEERRVQDPLPREVDRVIPHYDASSGQMKPVRSTADQD